MTKRILFVCHGNICRSPMAEFIFRDLIKRHGIADRFTVASRATHTDEIRNGAGNPVYPPAKAELATHGISCDGKRAELLRPDDYERYDLFIGMDGENIRCMHRIFVNADGVSDPDGKIRKLTDYTGQGGDIADPWYTDRFDVAFSDISKGCAALMRELLNEES